MSGIKVMVVDDSALARRAFQDVFEHDPELQLVATASDPFVAASRMRDVVPDVLVLNIEMPRMDGLTFLRKIMRQHPIPTVICSSIATSGSPAETAALEAGAVNVIAKPATGLLQFFSEARDYICDVVRAAAQAQVHRLQPLPTIASPPKLTADAVLSSQGPRTVTKTGDRIVAVGASTGGTDAVRVLLEGMTPDCPGVVIVLHMPETFTASYAQRLNQLCDIEVSEAVDGEPVLRGHAYVAPGNRHLVLNRLGGRYHVSIKGGPLVSRHRPSVDVLFRSAALAAGPNAVGVIMTGMGDDGAQGLKEMRDAGALTIAQDEATSVVFGMPAEAIRLGGACHVLPLPALSGAVMRMCAVA